MITTTRSPGHQNKWGLLDKIIMKSGYYYWSVNNPDKGQ
jgi:hypothetical protein